MGLQIVGGMKDRILTTILVPVVAVTAIVAVWATTIWVPPLLGFIQKRTEASLRLITRLGLEKCENSFNYLLDLRLEDDASMTASLKRETLSEIRALSDQFEKIHILVLDTHGHVVSMSKSDPAATAAMVMRNVRIDGSLLRQFVFDQPSLVSVLYFPIWRWYVVGYIAESDFQAPVNMARKVIFGGFLAVLLSIVLTAGIAFYLRVNRPLQRIISAAGDVAAGRYQKVAHVGNDEIGQVAGAFNAMVQSLEDDQRKIDDILSALRESEELYRVVTENSLSYIILMHKGEVIFANRKVLQDSGYSMRELLGREALTHIHPDDRRSVRRMVRKRIVGHSVPSPMECRYTARNGEIRWIELAVLPTTYQGELAVLIHGTDITQRKVAFEEQQRLEARLRQAQKMEAIGTLAGGIAHDFNNLLMGIQGNAALMQAKVAHADPFNERLRNIQQYVRNGAELTSQLLGYARGGKYEVKPLNINDLAAQSSHMFGRTKKEIVIRHDMQPDIWSVEADQGQIEQVLLNLYVNAWQAMPGGGELFLQTRNVVLSENDTKTMPIESGEYVCISVTDTGIGMDAETLTKIFDPFFTTRQRQRGTGLGLASAYGIIRNHGGSIGCRSKPNEGATFDIYLPRSNKSPIEEDTALQNVETGSETILLVDDEQMVLSVGEDMLAYLGYAVITAQNGRAAVDIVKQRGKEIDLVILDMIMPDLGGAETFELLREVDPQMPILLCTGYSMDGQASKIIARGCNGFIQKPFDLEALSTRVREVLENCKPSPR